MKKTRIRLWLAGQGLALLLISLSWALAEEAVKPAPAPSAPKTLSLEEAIRTALENNPTVRIAQAQYDKARARVSEARAGYGPVLSAASTYTRMGPIPTFSIPTTSGVETVQIGVAEDTRSKISVALPLDISGEIGAAVDAAALGRLAAQFALAAAQQNVVLQTQEGYLAVLRTAGLKAVAEEALAASQEHLRIAQVNFKAGVAPRFDVLRAEVQVANFQQQLLQASNAVELAKSSLNFTMGVNVNQAMEAQTPEAEKPITPPSVEESQQEASKRRPEILQAAALMRAAQRGIRLAKASLLPSFFVSANSNYDANPGGLGGLEHTWDVNVGATIKLFDSGQTQGRVRQARAEAEAAGQAAQLTEHQVMLEVRSAYLSLLEAAERMRATEKDVEQAREALRLAQLRYKAGLSPVIEVTDAEVALAQSRTNQVNAYYDYLLAKARLEKAVGRPAQEILEKEKR